MTTRMRGTDHRHRAAHLGARLDPPDRGRAAGAGLAAAPPAVRARSRCSPSSPSAPGARSPWATALAGLVAVLLVWWRAHPASFDRWAAPRIRSAWRRWTVYRGRRWAGLLDECELTRDHRRTGATLCPRVLRVRVGDPVDRHPRRADGPRAGPADLDRPHPRPRRRPARRTGRGLPPPARGAHRDRGAAQPVPARPRRHPHPRHRRPRSTCPGSTSGTTSTAARSC